jgi:hypothetical protein
MCRNSQTSPDDFVREHATVIIVSAVPIFVFCRLNDPISKLPEAGKVQILSEKIVWKPFSITGSLFFGAM